MDSENSEIIETSLKGYKEKISPTTKATLTWEKELIFTGRTQQGYEIEFDAHIQWGCKPTDALLLSLAGCMGIDVVTFLQKMKTVIENFKIEVFGERNPTPPQYFKSVEIILYITGSNLEPRNVERAVSLSQKKYCSVYNSLRSDLDVKVKYVLEERGPEQGVP